MKEKKIIKSKIGNNLKTEEKGKLKLNKADCQSAMNEHKRIVEGHLDALYNGFADKSLEGIQTLLMKTKMKKPDAVLETDMLNEIFKTPRFYNYLGSSDRPEVGNFLISS